MDIFNSSYTANDGHLTGMKI